MVVDSSTPIAPPPIEEEVWQLMKDEELTTMVTLRVKL
jgi:hypothetical protein